jgi:CobQ-like glutamine amidotransferase family enzyme
LKRIWVNFRARLFAAEDQIRIFEYVHPLVLSLSPFLKSNMIKSNKNLKKKIKTSIELATLDQRPKMVETEA